MHGEILLGLRAALWVLAGVLLAGMPSAACQAQSVDRVPISIEHHAPGAPITLGIPFPQGALHSPDRVRLTDASGREVPAQVNEVTTWAPADSSVKWIWVFFFAGDTDQYVLEYGENVSRTAAMDSRIQVVNNMRRGGGVSVNTGPLQFVVDQDGSGFLSTVALDVEGDGFEADDIIARGPEGRGSFLDLLDEAGIDSSRARVDRTWVEKGTGPMHAIIRVEGTYTYGRADNNEAPFVTRIHAYAGKPYIRVLHTMTYTGDPDMRPPLEGEHPLIATQPDSLVDEVALEDDERVTQPNDRITGAGLALAYQIDGTPTYATSYRTGSWWNPGEARIAQGTLDAQRQFSVVQLGPDEVYTLEANDSTPTERIDGFSARIQSDDTVVQSASRATGWVDLADDRWGVGIGMRHFFEEYPSEIRIDIADTTLAAYMWSPQADPMSFARSGTEEDGGMVGNFAQGLTKTTEFVYDFHDADKSHEEVARTLGYILDPPVAHADPAWYAGSRVYGSFAPYTEDQAAYERGLTYKFDWWAFNQNWEPWYGLFNYGDGKNYYFRGDWYQWTNNEPATDYMWWLQFMRTGDRNYYLQAEAASRHSMDVDNTHWPTKPQYVGDSNASLDALKPDSTREASPYLGMGRRHARQQWVSMLSAHVWVPGWVASYYLSGYHRGLDIAKLTADYYTKRVFKEHGLTGRRLYLSVWNLAEVYDATKSSTYRAELDDRVDRMLALQNEQGGSLVIDRYGYAQVYASHGLGKYLQMTGDARVRAALVQHARRVRDVPPLNHGMESYLSSIHSLLTGYKLTQEPSFFEEAYRRSQVLRTEALTMPDPFGPDQTQEQLAEALEGVSNLPDNPGPRPSIWKITNGLRIFGWTHIYNVPYLLYWLEQDGAPRTGSQATLPYGYE